MRPDAALAGVHDPLRRLHRPTVERRLHAALEPFGTVVVHDAGAVIAAAAYPDGVPQRPDAGLLCLVDGYLEDGADPGDVAAAWRADGPAGLERLRGAFAALVWDERLEEGCLVRDQLGQRPLFTLESGPVLWFATEVAPLIALPDRRPEPDPVAVARYLAPSRLREETVPFSGVRRVPGGHVVRLGRRAPRTPARYWTPRYRGPLDGSPEELAEQTRAWVTDAIRRTTAGVTSAGVLLSGGLDSTTVASLAAPELRRRGGRLQAYSQTFPTHPTVDESEQITVVAEHAGIPLTRMEVYAGSSLASTLEYLDRFGVPEFSATGFFWRPLARRAAQDGVETLLSGEGGDEVFGTPLFLIADRLRQGRVAAAMSLVERFPNIAYNPWRALRARLLWEYGVLPNLPRRLHLLLQDRHGRAERPAYMSRAGLALRGPAANPQPWRAFDGPAWWAGKLDHFARSVWQLGAPEQTTRAARLAGVRERHPLLTLDLVERALTLPPERGFDPERTRPDQRRAMAGIVPDAVRLRPDKVDFDAIRGHSLIADRPVVTQLLGDPHARIGPWVRPEVVQGLLDVTPGRWGHLSSWSGEVMRLLTAECFLREQEDPGFARRILDGGYLPPSKLEFA